MLTDKKFITALVTVVAGGFAASGYVQIGTEEQAAIVENLGLIVAGVGGLAATFRGIAARRARRNG